MKNIANLFDNINRYTGYLCAFLVVLMTVNVFIVVFLRYLFGISFIWLQETYVWMHAYIFMAGAGFTYLNDAHVRIDIIYRSSSKVYKAIVDLVGNIFLLMPFFLSLSNLPHILEKYLVLNKQFHQFYFFQISLIFLF